MSYRIVTALVCDAPELHYNVDQRCAELFQVGDIVKISLMLPDNADLFERLQGLHDDQAIALYRNTLWIKMKVLRREFFMFLHSDNHDVQTLAIYVEPLNARAFGALSITLKAIREANNVA